MEKLWRDQGETLQGPAPEQREIIALCGKAKRLRRLDIVFDPELTEFVFISHIEGQKRPVVIRMTQSEVRRARLETYRLEAHPSKA